VEEEEEEEGVEEEEKEVPPPPLAVKQEPGGAVKRKAEKGSGGGSGGSGGGAKVARMDADAAMPPANAFQALMQSKGLPPPKPSQSGQTFGRGHKKERGAVLFKLDAEGQKLLSALPRMPVGRINWYSDDKGDGSLRVNSSEYHSRFSHPYNFQVLTPLLFFSPPPFPPKSSPCFVRPCKAVKVSSGD
jgi:hypothetical protein